MNTTVKAILCLLGTGSLISGCLGPVGSGTTSATSATTKTTTASSSGTSTTVSGTTTLTATSGSSSVGDETEIETETEGCTFLGCDTEAPSDECHFFGPDCPEGTKCMPWSNDGGSVWNAYRCAPLDPNPVGPGDVCTAEMSGVSGIDNCAVHSMCWDVDHETKEGVCIAFCDGADYEDLSCDVGFRCTVFGDPALFLCLPTCDPLLQDCGSGETCLPNGDTFSCVVDASGPEVGVYGDPCEYANGCDPGLYCMSPMVVEGCQAAGCCSPWCDTTEPLSCPGATQECIAWYEEGMEPPGYEHVGICAVPR